MADGRKTCGFFHCSSVEFTAERQIEEQRKDYLFEVIMPCHIKIQYLILYLSLDKKPEALFSEHVFKSESHSTLLIKSFFHLMYIIVCFGKIAWKLSYKTWHCQLLSGKVDLSFIIKEIQIF